MVGVIEAKLSPPERFERRYEELMGEPWSELEKRVRSSGSPRSRALLETLDRLRRMSDDEPDQPKPVNSVDPVQQHVDAVIGALAKGKTSRPQEDALGRALQDRKLGRAVSR